MFDGPESDRLQIRELIDRYSSAVNRRDASALAECWADDGRWHLRATTVEGRPAIIDRWQQAMAGFRSVFFMAFPGAIRVEGEAAEVMTHTFEYLDPADGTPRLQAGLYTDRVVRTAGGWRFAERSFTPMEIRL